MFKQLLKSCSLMHVYCDSVVLVCTMDVVLVLVDIAQAVSHFALNIVRLHVAVEEFTSC